MEAVRFQVLTATSVKMRAFWDIAPCSLGVYRRFRRAFCLHHQRVLARSSPMATTLTTKPWRLQANVVTVSTNYQSIFISKR
jgi:hypothetical protein